MKSFILLLTILAFNFTASSQQFAWIKSDTVKFDMNFQMPLHLICATDDGIIYTARTDSGVTNFGQDLFGTAYLERHDANGQLIWSKYFGNNMVITHLATDNIGNLYVAGKFMDSLNVASDTVLSNTGTVFNVNFFLLSFDLDGNLRWIQNKTTLQTPFSIIEVITTDLLGNLWYSFADFMTMYLIKVDNKGDDIQAYLLEGTRTLGAMDFDPMGNLYISGSAQSGTLTIAGVNTMVPEAYMMFLARINTLGQVSWVRLAHDVTFQSPVVVADKWGNASLCGSIMDSTSWGNVHFHPSQWLFDIFLTHVDSLGNFLWGIQVPLTSTIQGDFERAYRLCIDNDSLGNIYLIGKTRGSINWGNNVTSGSGQPIDNEISILSFTPTGTPRWAIGGAHNAVANAFNVDVTPAGDCYFACAVYGTASFDTVTFNSPGMQAVVFGKIIDGLSTAINENNSSSTVFVWPNPASDKLYISGISEQKHPQYTIFNIQNQAIRSGILNTNNIDVTALKPGIYLLQIGEGIERKAIKFICQ